MIYLVLVCRRWLNLFELDLLCHLNSLNFLAELMLKLVRNSGLVRLMLVNHFVFINENYVVMQSYPLVFNFEIKK